MAYTKFEAKKNVKVYKEMSTSSDKAGTIYKDAVFKAQASTNASWYRVKEIVSGTSNGVVEKYYVHQNSSKSNFDTTAGGTASDVTSVSKNYQYDPSSVTNTSPTRTTENADGTETVDTSTVTSVNLSEDDIANLTIDDAFFTPYTKFQPTDAAYAAALDDGLRINDIRGVLGIPHQFSSITDPRFNSGWNDDSSLGRVYAEKFIKQMPLLLLTPGVPEFMSEFSDDQKSRVVDQLFGMIGASNLNELIDGKSGKYYSLRFAYDAYFQFVNPMLRTAAYYLNLENKVVGSKSLGSYHWLYDSFDTGLSSNRVPGETFDKFLGPYVGCVAFYANCGNEINISPKGIIVKNGSEITVNNEKAPLDIVGRYTVEINGKTYDTVCVIDAGTYNESILSEQFIDKNGRTILWRRFNQNNWAYERYGKLWSEALPDNERLTVNGEVYVHWYDCVSEYIF
jgi:hypothetical protein